MIGDVAPKTDLRLGPARPQPDDLRLDRAEVRRHLADHLAELRGPGRVEHLENLTHIVS
ncbi:hypothetical protein DM45_3233 [Burkholderia mallei]|nr:hypothetical protein DM45_3233 [Burkholderia mallei]